MSGARDFVGSRKIAVIMCSFDRGSADNESEQHNRQRAGKRGAHQIQLVLQLSSHVFYGVLES